MNVADPLPIGRLLDEAVRLARRNFRTIFLPTGIPVAIGAAITTALQASFGLEGPGGGEDGPPLWRMVAWGASMLVYLLVFMFAYGAMMAATLDAAAGRPLDMGRSWLVVARPRLLATWILAFFGFLLGLVCCVLPGMYVALLWTMATAAVLEEGRWGPDALGRSAELMRHNPSRQLGNHPMLSAFLIYVAGALLSYAISALVAIPMIVVMVLAGIRSSTTGASAEEFGQAFMWVQVPTQFLSALAQMAVQVFTMTALALLYFELRRRREGDDLLAAVETVGVQPSPTA